MNDNQKIYEDFQRSIRGLEGKLHFLDTEVSMKTQMDYFRFIGENRTQLEAEGERVGDYIDLLNLSESTEFRIAEMKFSMAVIALSKNVEAYRFLEAYRDAHTEDELRGWTELALLHAKMTLESEFSEEVQVFVSSGLGGKNNKLRFYAFFKSANLDDFSDYQKKLIEKEFPFYILKHQGELEELSVFANYFTLLFLLGVEGDVQIVLKEALDECNQYGNFIHENFMITNIKIPDQSYIENELQKKDE